MILQLHPRAAPRTDDSLARLQVWVGAFGAGTAPALQWTVNGHPAEPVAVRPWVAAAEGVFAAVFEFSEPDVAAGGLYAVRATGPGGAEGRLETRTLPAEVPGGLSDSFFNVLLVSCFHLGEDRNGRAGRLIARLPPRWRPHLTLLLGDQVYLDIPTLKNYQDDKDWLREKFVKDYESNWKPSGTDNGYWDILAAAPSAAIPDDHEYWNNYPHAAPLLPVSWAAQGQRNWGEVAREMFDAFQRPAPGAQGGTVAIDVPPLSFLLIDSRSHRELDGSRALFEKGLDEVKTWCDRVADRRWFGVVATGQSLLADARGRWRQTMVDSGLPDHGDYAGLVRLLSGLADEGRPVILITGDVHWGRVVVGRHRASGAAALYEIISSPSSLLTQVGRDQVNTIGNAIASLFGRGDPWPRHSDPKPAPDFFARQVLGRRLECRGVGKLKGNHAVMISFQQSGSGLRGEVVAWPIPLDGSDAQPVGMGTLTLNLR